MRLQETKSTNFILRYAGQVRSVHPDSQTYKTEWHRVGGPSCARAQVRHLSIDVACNLSNEFRVSPDIPYHKTRMFLVSEYHRLRSFHSSTRNMDASGYTKCKSFLLVTRSATRSAQVIATLS